MNVDIQPATRQRWPDLERLFDGGGTCDGCWCLFFRLPRSQYKVQSGLENRQIMQAMVESGQEPGLLAYVDGQVAAWVALGPRQDFAALASSRNLRPVDDTPVWSVVCFYVAKPYRRQGLLRALLDGAADYARLHGAAVLEGYPIEPDAPRFAGKRLSGATGNEGIASAFRAAGFAEVKRASAHQLIMRKHLQEA